MGRVGRLNAYVFKLDPWSRDVVSLEADPHVISVQRQEKRMRVKREILDPEYPNQWHLHDQGNHVHMNVQNAWNLGYHGEGVNIAICDDGVDTHHDDLKLSFLPNSSYNFNFDSEDVNPRGSQDNHGTSAAGCALARDDGLKCGVGVAYRSGLSGIVLLQKSSITDAQEAGALQFKNQINHIYSNSWGPPDNGKNLIGPGPLTRKAIDDSIREGRDGKGNIYVWAAGNGGARKDNCNYDGYASSRKVVAVSAIGFDGVAPYYAEKCSALLGVATSGTSGSDINSKITTSAIENKCNSRFSGTSAACPVGAGVVALILQANPDLNWLDLQKVLVETAQKVDDNHNDWIKNGAGYWVNHLYGFGIFDTSMAVQKALEMRGEEGMKENLIHYHITVEESFRSLVQYEFEVQETFQLHHAEVSISLAHPKSGNLLINLISPSGTPSILAELHDDSHADIKNWTYTTKRLWGEQSYGTWKLIISEAVTSGGFTQAFDLKMYGTPNPEIDTDKYRELRIKEGNIEPPQSTPIATPEQPKKVFYSTLLFGILPC